MDNIHVFYIFTRNLHKSQYSLKLFMDEAMLLTVNNYANGTARMVNHAANLLTCYMWVSSTERPLGLLGPFSALSYEANDLHLQEQLKIQLEN